MQTHCDRRKHNKPGEIGMNVRVTEQKEQKARNEIKLNRSKGNRAYQAIEFCLYQTGNAKSDENIQRSYQVTA